jgi:hypothetical protein
MEPLPVITGIISNEEQWIRLSTTSAYIDGKGKTISDAEVIVSDGINSYVLHESFIDKGLYIPMSEISIKQDSEYKLTVRADFAGNGIKEEYHAASKVARTPELDSVTVQVTRMFDDLLWFVQINFQDVNHPNSYLCRVYVNNVPDIAFDAYEIFDNRYGQGEYMSHKLIKVVFEHPFTEEKIQIGDVIRVNFSGITKDYFNFLYSAMKEVGGGNPLFSGPPANVKGNISNGALGVFTVYLSSSLSVVITDIYD